MKDKLTEEERKLRVILRECEEKEQLFLEAATQFSHPANS